MVALRSPWLPSNREEAGSSLASSSGFFLLQFKNTEWEKCDVISVLSVRILNLSVAGERKFIDDGIFKFSRWKRGFESRRK